MSKSTIFLYTFIHSRGLSSKINVHLYMDTFTLKGEYIQLIQLLKAMNWVEHGAMAQEVVTEGLVKYNGKVDFRKRLKVRVGDIVEFEGNKVEVI